MKLGLGGKVRLRVPGPPTIKMTTVFNRTSNGRGLSKTVIHGIVVDCADPITLSEFWQAVLGWEYRMQEDNWVSLRNPAGSPHLSFQMVPEDKVVKNRVHLDIRPGMGTLDQERLRIENLGATTLQFFDKGEWSHYVTADPEGNEFCVLSPEHGTID